MCRRKQAVILVLALALQLFVLGGCTRITACTEEDAEIELTDLAVPLAGGGESETRPGIAAEAQALAATAGAPVYDLLLPEASGQAVKRSSKAVLDYSNAKDGYVMVQFFAASQRKLKVRVAGPNTEDPYQYNLEQGQWTVFPLSDGDGKYKVTVYEQNPSTGKYASVLSHTFAVALTDEFAPFLRPNQYVDYAEAEETLAKAAELCGEEEDPLKKVENVYEFVVNNLTYDKKKAKTVQSGYLPVLDSVLAEKKGICFDYAALMTGMLRSQGVPCKLVVGYAGEAYHAWISVWTEESGWIDSVIYFDGEVWQRMDPTFASSGKSSKSILKYIGDGSNYTEKNLY